MEDTQAINLDFGQALVALKSGNVVARHGWNGKGMFIYLNKGAVDLSTSDAPGAPDSITHVNSVRIGLFERWQGNIVTRMPNINMKAADGSTVTGWLASQTDMLADDWEIVSPT